MTKLLFQFLAIEVAPFVHHNPIYSMNVCFSGSSEKRLINARARFEKKHDSFIVDNIALLSNKYLYHMSMNS